MSSFTQTSFGHRSGSKAHTKPGSIVSRIFTFQGIWKERQRLAAMDDHLLKDIGLTREDVQKEAKRPTWDAPERWLR